MALSQRSEKNLSECRPELGRVFRRVYEIIGCEIFVGKRDKATQNQLFKEKKSKVQWPNSKHNTEPLSSAVDAMPLPVSFDAKKRDDLLVFAGIVLAVAHAERVKIRWGGDWNQNLTRQDETFSDLYHFELVD